MSEVTEGELLRTQRQLDALTGLRIVAALWVVAHHLSRDALVLLPWLSALEPLSSRGGLGVDLFFILSGFILSYNYLATLGSGLRLSRYLRFIQLRVARVYPVHLFTLITAALLIGGAALLNVGFSTGTENTPLTFVENLLLVQAWFGQPYSWNGVAWSVSAEWFAYLLFPVAAILLVKVKRSWVAILASLLTVGTLVWFVTVTDPLASDDRPDRVLLRVSVAFLLGCFLHRVYLAARPHFAWKVVTTAAVVAVLVLAYLPGAPSTLFLPFLGLVILGLAVDGGPVGALLSTRVFVYGGLISYSVYMIHSQVLQVAGVVLLDPLRDASWVLGLAAILLTVGLVIAAAAIIFKFVEEPSRAQIRKINLSRRAKAA